MYLKSKIYHLRKKTQILLIYNYLPLDFTINKTSLNK